MSALQAMSLGCRGEALAAGYLEKHGLRVVARHYRQKWGEIDLVVRDGDTWVFVEVKTRSSLYKPSAADSITPQKKRRLIRAAHSYMKWMRLEGCDCRFDVILIEGGRIEWIPNAFDVSSRFAY